MQSLNKKLFIQVILLNYCRENIYWPIKKKILKKDPPSKEQEKISKFEIMDGKPEPGDMIPFRLNLRQVYNNK